MFCESGRGNTIGSSKTFTDISNSLCPELNYFYIHVFYKYIMYFEALTMLKSMILINLWMVASRKPFQRVKFPAPSSQLHSRTVNQHIFPVPYSLAFHSMYLPDSPNLIHLLTWNKILLNDLIRNVKRYRVNSHASNARGYQNSRGWHLVFGSWTVKKLVNYII